MTNPVLEYAIEHQAAARTILISRSIPPSDVDDICQEVVVKIMVVSPPNCRGPASYWYKTLRTAIADYWRRHNRQPLPFTHDNGDGELVRDRADSRQDIDHQINVLEALRQAGNIIRATTPKERGAMTAHLRGEPMDNAQRQRLHQLRKRLRAAVA